MRFDWGALWRELGNWSWWDGSKFALTALIIVVVTKVQVVNDKLSALIIALPLMSLLAMVWMRVEKQSNERIATHAESTFWFVLPTLPMFLVLPWMLRKGWGFGVSLITCCALTIVLFFLMAFVLRRMGLKVI